MENITINSEINTHKVEGSCGGYIKTIFQTLLLERGLKQQDVANDLNFDKAYISRVFNAVEIPCLEMRLKIAKYFGVDSCLIWRVKDLDFIRELIKKQKRKNGG